MQVGSRKRGSRQVSFAEQRSLCSTVTHLWPCPAFPKALQIATETNCITEFLQESENQLRKVKLMEKQGLLYGVPVSIKDSINCQVPPAQFPMYPEIPVG